MYLQVYIYLAIFGSHSIMNFSKMKCHRKAKTSSEIIARSKRSFHNKFPFSFREAAKRLVVLLDTCF